VLGFDPQDTSAALLWTQVLLVWSMASYLPGNDPAGHPELEVAREKDALASWKRQVWARGIAAGAVIWMLPGCARPSSIARVSLALLVMAAVVALPLVRVSVGELRNALGPSLPGIPTLRVQRGVWLAEWELGLNTLVAGSSWVLVAHGGLSVEPWIRLPLGTECLSAITGCIAVAMIVTRGGAFVVRGMLNKVGALPIAGKGRDNDQVDLVEFSRGRIIGVLERLIVLVLMAVQAYQAIAFLMAAKGLILRYMAKFWTCTK